jgi:hypothetical protein
MPAEPEEPAEPAEEEEEEESRVFGKKIRWHLAIEIDGATGYWLEDEAGRRIGEISEGTEAPLAAVLAAVRDGQDMSGVNLVCHVPGDGKIVFLGGDELVHLAEWTTEVNEAQQASVEQPDKAQRDEAQREEA